MPLLKHFITDIDPDHKVKDAMNRINAAKRDREAAHEDGEAKKIMIVKQAEAEAESKRLVRGRYCAAKTFRDRSRVSRNLLKISRSLLDTVTHEEIMQFVLMTQYFDTIKDIGANSKNSSISDAAFPRRYAGIPRPNHLRDFCGQQIK